jgi:uncharacterized membrane protein YvlD (DUF360 family)
MSGTRASRAGTAVRRGLAVRLAISVGVYLAAAALGLLLTGVLVDGVAVRAQGFLVAVVVFAVVQSLLTPWVAMLARRHATWILGGFGLISTFLALLVAQSFSTGLSIRGASAWISATVLVWVVGAIASAVLPLLLVKRAVQTRRARTEEPAPPGPSG